MEDGLTTLDPAELGGRERYALLIGLVVPRPIGWITTRSAAGVVNLAPFSFFNGVSSSPPILSVAIGRRRDGSRKDTARNILETGEFVHHLVERGHLEPMVASSAEYPPETSEPAALGLELVRSERVSVPALACARARLECRLERHLEVGGSDLILGRVLCVRLSHELLGPRGALDESRLRPLGRLGGAGYAPVERRLEQPRPPAVRPEAAAPPERLEP
jgi:flavin reductase (DIM6/NTAB) family NADH-FMN oxidoreductase RutF